MGYKYENTKISDVILAKSCPDLNLIIGGHTHSFLEEGHLIQHIDGRETLITQTGWGGIKLGKILIEQNQNRISFQSCKNQKISV